MLTYTEATKGLWNWNGFRIYRI